VYVFTFVYNEGILRGLKIVMANKRTLRIVFKESYVAVQCDLCFLPSASRSTTVLPK